MVHRPVGDVDGRVAGLLGDDFHQRDDFLHLREQGLLEGSGREPIDGLIERVGGRGGGDLDERHAEGANRGGQHLPGERLVGEAAGVLRRALAIVIGCVVVEGAIRTIVLLPEVAQGDPVGFAQPRLADGEALGARAQQEALFDLRVSRAELVDDHFGRLRAPVRVVGRQREHAARRNLGHRDVAEVVRQVRPAPS